MYTISSMHKKEFLLKYLNENEKLPQKGAQFIILISLDKISSSLSFLIKKKLWSLSGKPSKKWTLGCHANGINISHFMYYKHSTILY